MEAIYAIDANGGLSIDGKIPWVSKKDMQFFVNKTKHHIVVMGRNTFFSLPENVRPLKNRLNIVLTSRYKEYNETYKEENLLFLGTLDFIENFERTIQPDKYPFLYKDCKIFIIGGKMVYEKYIPLCKTVWMTRLKKDYFCDCTLNYDFSREFAPPEIIDEDDELIIYKYTTI